LFQWSWECGAREFGKIVGTARDYAGFRCHKGRRRKVLSEAEQILLAQWYTRKRSRWVPVGIR